MNVYGIDVSFCQGNFDFSKAKAEGVKYAIIRVGQKNYADSMFERNYKAAKAAGLDVGAYFVGEAKNAAEAKKEAAYCSMLLEGKQFEYPIFYDVETPQMITGIDNLTNVIKAFCNAMEKYGYWCGFYTNLDWYRNKMNGASLAKRYSFWFAWWSSQMYKLPNVQMWQPGAKNIAGVYTDYDSCFVDYPSMIKKRGKNGFKKGGSVTPAPTPAPAPATRVFKKGDKITLASDAVVYGTTRKFAPFVYNMAFYIREINGDRAVFAPAMEGAVTGAVDVKYLKKA